MKVRSVEVGLVAVVLAILAGCSSASGPALSAARGPSAAAVQASPESFQGQRVRRGGTIVAMHQRPGGVDIEVAGRPLDATGRPEPGDGTTGRFGVRASGPVDPAYAVGQSITAFGQVTPMGSWWDYGDPVYRYPVLTYAELVLWPPNTTTGGVYVGERYWVWPYTFWQGPPPYVPRVTTW